MAVRRERLDEDLDKRGNRVEGDDSVRSASSLVALRVENLIYYILGIFEALLVLRLVFKLFGANPANAFVSAIYSITGYLIAPFTAIFPIASTEGTTVAGVLEPATLIAIVIYGLVAWAIAALISSVTSDY